MRYFSAIISAVFLVLGGVAQAGDPCPIPVNIADLGSPDWLDNAALINDLQSRQIWIGISFDTLDEGLELTRVFEGSPAEAAGLLRGDIITMVGARRFSDEAVLSGLNIGETVKVSLLRDDQPLTVLLTVGGVDPVPLGMVQALQDSDCRDPALTPPSAVTREAIMARVFTQSRGFRCEDAHVALEPLMEQYQSDTVYIVRGHRRLLLTMPYYGTACVPVGALDGDNLNNAELSAVIERVIRAYVRERHENP